MEQSDFLAHTIDALNRAGIVYMVVGSFASIVYGEWRSTHDIDIVIDPTIAQLDALCDAFPPDQFYVSKEAARAALQQRSQFNVIDPSTSGKVDFMIARDDAYAREQLTRRCRLILMGSREAYAARPEDVILGKLIYYDEGGSDKHLRDITGILLAGNQPIDYEYIERWVAHFGFSDIWKMVKKKAQGSP